MEFQAVFEAFGEKLLQLLPLSPFTQFIDQFRGLPFLGYLNWFFPVGDCLKVMAAWLTAVGLFYLYSILMRWLKVIGD
jgi:hypothetical protein